MMTTGLVLFLKHFTLPAVSPMPVELPLCILRDGTAFSGQRLVSGQRASARLDRSMMDRAQACMQHRIDLSTTVKSGSSWRAGMETLGTKLETDFRTVGG